MTSLPSTLSPPVIKTEAGTPRRVGVEIEFTHLELDQIARLVVDLFGGEIFRETDYEVRVSTPDLGEFRIEIDLLYLKRLGQARSMADEAPGLWERMSEDLVAAVAHHVVPCEIVTPPLTFDRLIDLDRLVERLREAGAKGTRDALVYAFGVHFNPEAPSLRAESLLAYLRAFVILYDWLKAELRVDTARRLSPFIRAFPIPYVQTILKADYGPTMASLIDDYLAYNPTRNRALDMLPLFTHIDRDRVLAVVDDPHIYSRPTYHYRLSNSQVGDPYWHLTDEWRYWLVVESLAHNPEKLTAMAADYLAVLNLPFGDVFSSWTNKTKQWLDVL